MARLTALISLLLCFSACGGTPTSSSSSPFTLSGGVFNASSQALAAFVTRPVDGIQAKRKPPALTGNIASRT